MGVQGAEPPGGGVGGVPFRPNPLTPFPAREGGKFAPPQRGAGESLTPKTLQTLSRRGWVKGVQGAKPHGGGLWGVSPHKFKRGGE